MVNQVVTISFFRFKTLKNKFWAFTMMQAAQKQLAAVPNQPNFYKFLGSGGKDGFSWKPNFSVYGLLCVWDDESTAREFFQNSEIYKNYVARSVEHCSIYLKASKSHGSWSKVNPFIEQENLDTNGKVAILTRATIRFSKLYSFWRRVAGVSRSLENYGGRQFSIGIGEWPWIQQATFSIWDSEEQMIEYAYKNPIHKKIIQLTREKRWYREEMFVRFRTIKADGRWGGVALSHLGT